MFWIRRDRKNMGMYLFIVTNAPPALLSSVYCFKRRLYDFFKK